jgi:DNA-binding MarR family transcriptional regulator
MQRISSNPNIKEWFKDATIKIINPMKAIFKSSVQDQMLRSFIMVFLLVERSLKVRSKGKITIREAFILEMIDRLSPLKQNTPSVIAKILNISLPSLSVTIKSLLKKQYATKALSTDDNRFYYIQLSPEGKAFIEKNHAFRDNLTHKTLGVLNIFSDLIAQKIANAVEQYAREEHALLDQLEKDSQSNP